MHKILKQTFSLIIFIFSISLSIIAQDKKVDFSTPEKLVEKAVYDHDIWKNKKSKQLLLEAIDLGSDDACYLITDFHNLSEDEELKYLLISSKHGHLKSFDKLFYYYFLESRKVGSMFRPTLVNEAYKEGVKHNIEFNNVKYLYLLENLMEVGPFDLDKFCSKYNLDKEAIEEDPFYSWKLAEEASKDGRFGKYNSNLILELVSLGGFSPNGKSNGLSFAYENWKYNKKLEFKMCEHVSSAWGYGICQERKREKQVQKRNSEIFILKDKVFSDETSIIFAKAFDSACKFYEDQQYDEAIIGYGFGMYGQTEAGDQIEMFKVQYINVIKKINNHSYNDSISLVINSYDDFTLHDTHDVEFDWDKQLNIKYKQIVADLDNGYYFPGTFNHEKLRKIQLLWIKYRDETAVFFHKLDTSISEEYWENLITRDRVYQLEELYEMIEKE